MKIASSESSPYSASQVRREVNGKMANILDLGQSLVKDFNDDGYGTGFNSETKRGNWNLQVDRADGKPQAFDYHYEYIDNKLFR